jgi:nitrite reductase/ring-hydroxylating ferredoxin subunit
MFTEKLLASATVTMLGIMICSVHAQDFDRRNGHRASG